MNSYSEDVEAPAQLLNFTQETLLVNDPDADKEDVDLLDGDEDLAEAVTDEEAATAEEEDEIPIELLELMFDEEDNYRHDNSDNIVVHTPTPREVEIATNIDFEETLQKIIDDADGLAQVTEESIDNMNPEENDLYVDELPISSLCRTVLADTFHFMDRAKLPMHHEYKALFFRSLRAAIFIMSKSDVDDICEVLRHKEGTSWQYKMAFEFEYIAKRVRRIIPPANILYFRMKAVYCFFKNKIDSKTNVILFHDKNKGRFERMLELVKKGYASDPIGMNMYVHKTDKYGKVMLDQDGLKLYRSLRGTSNLESTHQYLTTSFGHTAAGPLYSDTLLTVVRHFYNWRMSMKNRPDYPKLMHYDGLKIDCINSYYEIIFGRVKYSNWISFNEALPLESVYGIVKVEEELSSSIVPSLTDKKHIASHHMLKYLGERQGSPLPFLPLTGITMKYQFNLVSILKCHHISSNI